MTKTGKQGKGNGDATVGSHNEKPRKRVLEREYCSIACLLGLVHGGNIDPNCPNITDHGKRHLKGPNFLRQVQEQLARDRGRITDCEPLWISGSRGAMFKLTLTSHGYTVIAKGVRRHNIPHLEHEAMIYQYLRPLQGIHIPVCLGSTNLILPYYHQGCRFVRFLFQSYAGVPVFKAIKEGNKESIFSNISQAIKAIHQLRVLHRDPMPRNIMVDEKSGCVQIIDFERSKINERKTAVVRKKKLPLGDGSVKEMFSPSTSYASTDSMAEEPASQNGEEVMKLTDTDFRMELRVAISSTALCVS